MKKMVIGILIGVALTGLIAMKSGNRQNDRSVGRVKEVSGKFIFLNAEPVNDYEVAFEFEAKPMANSQVNTLDRASDFILRKAMKTSVEQNKEFDAIIVRSTHVHDLAIKFK